MEKLELYIHIPFCMKKCNYCDFLSASADEKSQSAYMEALKKEIAFYGKGFKNTSVDTIYIGGGTPSWLQEHYIRALIEKVKENFYIAPMAEISIECNPGTLTKGKLRTYRECGINRLSIGLQSADEEELKLLGRIHTFEQFSRNFELAREYGFENINVDLMSGLPKQTVKKYYETLKKVIRLKPEHISSYSLIIEKGTPFYDTYKYDKVRQEAGMATEHLPNENTEYQIGKMAQDVLIESGYDRYEISNYAREGKICHHNVGYWQRKDYLGLGLGAASLLENIRYSNIRDLEEYIEKSYNIEERLVITENRTPLYCSNLHQDAAKISRNGQMEEYMFLGLRMTEGIEKSRFYHTFGFTVDNIYGAVVKVMEQEELIVDTPSRLMLTDKGMDLSNYVLAKFLIEE